MQERLPACSVTIIMVKHERASRGESRAGVAAQSRGDRRPFHEKATSVKAVLRDLRRPCPRFWTDPILRKIFSG